VDKLNTLIFKRLKEIIESRIMAIENIKRIAIHLEDILNI